MSSRINSCPGYSPEWNASNVMPALPSVMPSSYTYRFTTLPGSVFPFSRRHLL